MQETGSRVRSDRAPDRPRRDLAAEPASTRSVDGREVRLARSEEAELDGRVEPFEVRRQLVRHPGRGWLRDHHDELDGVVPVEPPSASRVDSPATSADRSRPPTPRAWVTPTPAWSSRASSCWHPVPDAATRATGPGRQALAKPSPSPPTTAVPQSGPITRSPRSAAIRLSVTSWSTGTLSLKSITSRPASRASTASTRALAPGTDTRVKASGARRRAEPVVRGGATSPVPVAADLVVRAAATAARAASSASAGASSASRTATTMSLVVASAGTSKPIWASTATLSSVAIATCAAATPGVCATWRLTWRSATESAYAPGRSSTWVLMRPSPRCPGRGGRPPAGRDPTTHRPPSGPPPRPRLSGPARRRTRAAPRRAARSRAAWPRAAWSCAPLPGPRRRAWAARRRTCVASQPQATSSPYGVSPSPRPIPASTSSRRPPSAAGTLGTRRVDEPPHVHLGAAEEQRPAGEAGRRGVEAGEVGERVRRPFGTSAAPLASTPSAQGSGPGTDT